MNAFFPSLRLNKINFKTEANVLNSVYHTPDNYKRDIMREVPMMLACLFIILVALLAVVSLGLNMIHTEAKKSDSRYKYHLFYDLYETDIH